MVATVIPVTERNKRNSSVGEEGSNNFLRLQSHSPLLDIMRALAALLVLLGHTRNWFFAEISTVQNPSTILKLFWFLTVLEHEAVVVFFVLSGFLVGGATLKSFQDDKFSIADYMIARFSRIYAVYIPALIVTFVLFVFGNIFLVDFGDGSIRPLFSEYQPNMGGIRAMLGHVAGLQGFICKAWKENPALWSLGYEWTLYLFAPAIIWFGFTRKARSVRFLGVAFLLVGAGAIAISLRDYVFWFGAWFLGLFASLISRRKSLPVILGLLGLTLAIGAMAISRLKIVNIIETDIGIALGISIAISSKSLTTFPLLPRFAAWAASFSYSLYATHLPIVFLLIAIFQNMGLPKVRMVPGPLPFMAFCACVISSLLFAYVFSLLTERNTAKFRAYLRSKLLA